MDNVRLGDFAYSIRRYYVDFFLTKNISYFFKDARILDIGGKKINKRGYFDIGKYPYKVEYANIDFQTLPDILCDINHIPIDDQQYDGIICSETLEHIPEPITVLNEIYRLLKNGGIALITVPFMFHIHADPFDFGRYTEYYWKSNAEKCGFTVISIEYQGTIYAVIANLLKIWANEKLKENQVIPLNKIYVHLFIPVAIWLLMKRDALITNSNQINLKFKANTTGFGIILIKY